MQYLHAKYAGNFADLHKHWLLSQMLAALKPAQCYDSHGGAGLYPLEHSGQHYLSGVAKVWPLSARFIAHNPVLAMALQAVNDQSLAMYPGSPWLMLASSPRVAVAELNPEVAEILFRHTGIRAYPGDGFSWAAGVQPTSDDLLLIDPPYKAAAEYQAVAELYRHWQSGAVMIWYPLFADGREQAMLEALTEIAPADLQHELRFDQPGLCGSGVWCRGFTADNPLKKGLEWLAGELGGRSVWH